MTITELHTKHGKYLLDCLRLCGVPADACEDVRGNIYLKLLKKSNMVEDCQGLVAKIARNASIDYHRVTNSKGKEKPVQVYSNLTGDEVTIEELNKKSMEMWSASMDSIVMGRIESALVGASAYFFTPSITALMLLEMQMYGLNTDQIGEIFNCSGRTIRNWLNVWKKHARSKWPKK